MMFKNGPLIHFIFKTIFAVTQERLGIVDIVSSKSTCSFLPFKIERLNIGKAMNVSSGVFTAPI